MKKLCITWCLGIITLLAQAQTKFIRAYAMHKAEYIKEDWEFDEGVPSNTLIEVGDKKVIVHNQEIETYQLYNIDQELKNLTTWHAADAKGNPCVFYFGMTKQGSLYVMFEDGNKGVLYYGDSEE